MRTVSLLLIMAAVLPALSGCEAIREVTRRKTFSCDLRESTVVESPQCWSFDNIREADGSALQVRGLCLGLQSELVKEECPRDDQAMVSCLAAGALIPEEIQDLGINLEIMSYLDGEAEDDFDLQLQARELACEEGGGSVQWTAADEEAGSDAE